MIRNVNLELVYQQTIPDTPIPPKRLYENACANDEITIKSWRDIWLNNYKTNKEKAGSFKEKGIGQLFGLYRHRPVIVVGSGPSLKVNVQDLQDTKGIPILSCLHNFHYLEDNGVKPDYYVSLDAGDVTLEEVSEGGTKSIDEYLGISKDRKLLAFTGSSPKLIDSWKGDIYWFNAPIPDSDIIKETEKIEVFNTLCSNGGNVLGACFYNAKALFGGNPIIFVGADFSFSYDNKFHAWDSKYDKVELSSKNSMRVIDVFGNSVWTYPSYWNFKCWFDSRAIRVPGTYINATEGGIFGAYREGNIEAVKQKALKVIIEEYSSFEILREQCDNPETTDRKVLM